MNKSKWLDELLRQDYLVKEENNDPSIRDKLYAQAEAALQLQELVKEVIEHKLLYPKIGSLEACLVTEQTIDLLQSLVKESERNTSGGKS